MRPGIAAGSDVAALGDIDLTGFRDVSSASGVPTADTTVSIGPSTEAGSFGVSAAASAGADAAGADAAGADAVGADAAGAEH